MGCHFSAPGSFLVFPDSFLPILLCAAGSFPCQETKDNEQQDIHMAVLMFPGTPWIRHFHEICCQWSGQECCPGFSHPPDLYGTAPGFPAVHQIFWIRPYSRCAFLRNLLKNTVFPYIETSVHLYFSLLNPPFPASGEKQSPYPYLQAPRPGTIGKHQI